MSNLDSIKILLEIDTNVYDDKLNLLIPMAIEKLKIEGVPEILIDEVNHNMYVVCLSYQVALDLALDIDYTTVYRKYITCVNTLRSAIYE